MKNSVKIALIVLTIFTVVGIKILTDKSQKISDKKIAMPVIPIKKKGNRSPATITHKVNTRPLRGKRELLGTTNVKKYQDSSVPIQFSQEYNKKWKELFIKKLTDLLGAKTDIQIQSKKSYIKIFNGKGLYLEEIVVKLLRPDGSSSSYSALVDSSNGRTVRTWNQTYFEKNTYKIKLTPSRHL